MADPVIKPQPDSIAAATRFRNQFPNIQLGAEAIELGVQAFQTDHLHTMLNAPKYGYSALDSDIDYKVHTQEASNAIYKHLGKAHAGPSIVSEMWLAAEQIATERSHAKEHPVVAAPAAPSPQHFAPRPSAERLKEYEQESHATIQLSPADAVKDREFVISGNFHNELNTSIDAATRKLNIGLDAKVEKHVLLTGAKAFGETLYQSSIHTDAERLKAVGDAVQGELAQHGIKSTPAEVKELATAAMNVVKEAAKAR
jgi:hypothetical protein